MPRTLPFIRTMNGLIELGWLFLIIAVPTFFNVRDERVFEPDKIVLMRNTVLIMILLLLLKTLYLAPRYLPRWFGGPRAIGGTAASAREEIAAGSGAAFAQRWPIVVAAAIFMVIYLLATVHSIIPSISFWGSYDRLEGYYTYLNYIALFLFIATHLRTWNQVERLVTAIVVSSVPAAAYSWVQHFNQDPLIWGSNAVARTPSTLGNPIFLAAFELMAVPFTLYRLIQRIKTSLESARRGISGVPLVWQALGAVGYGVALVLQMTAIGFSGSRGPALGFLAALVVFGLSLAIRQRMTWLLRISVAFAVILVVVFGATNTVFRSVNTPTSGFGRFLHVLPSESDTSEVRSLLWKSSLTLAKAHPVLGCGPEVLLFCWYPDYPPDLRKIEAANAAPDRSHDEEIDVLLMGGILGELAYLAVLVTTIAALVTLIRRAQDFRAAAFACALLAAFIGHIVEGATGIAFSATLLLLWTIAGAASALRGGPALGVAGLFQGRADAAEPASTDVWSPAPALAMATAAPARGGSGAATAARGGSSRKSRQGNRRNQQAAPSRRQPDRERGPRYAFGDAAARLAAPAQVLLGVGVLAFIGITIGFGVLFAGNLQQVLADVSYRNGTAYETAAGNMTSVTIQQLAQQQPSAVSQYSFCDGLSNLSCYQQGLGVYQIAITDYQQALDTSSSFPYAGPPQDTYYLYLGKTYLEYADALNRDPSVASAATRHANAVPQIKDAIAVYERAAKNNPLNPDHPRNIAKVYSFWGVNASGGQPDVSLLRLADASFAKASSLAPHNADILDEWAALDIRLGGLDTGNAHHWYAEARSHLERARGLFPEDGNVYRDLGYVYYQYGEWAEAARQSQAAQSFYTQAKVAWLKALGGPPVTVAASNYQTVYPSLADVLLVKLHDLCDAGQYAHYALSAYHAGTLGNLAPQALRTLQTTVTNAQAQKCTIKQ